MAIDTEPDQTVDFILFAMIPCCYTHPLHPGIG